LFNQFFIGQNKRKAKLRKTLKRRKLLTRILPDTDISKNLLEKFAEIKAPVFRRFFAGESLKIYKQLIVN